MIVRGLRFAPAWSRTLLRLASAVLLAQSMLAWASMLGLADGIGAFEALEPAARNLLLLAAVLCPVAAIGAWFVSDWGPVLWWGWIVALGIALVVGAEPSRPIALAFVVHVVLAGAWLLTAARMERRGAEDDPA